MIAYLSYRIAAWYVSRASLRSSGAVALAIARLFHLFRPKVRRNTRRNLDAAGSGAATIDVFRWFARATRDFLLLGTARESDLLDSCRIVGRDRLDAALAAGRGAILFLPHLGPWEVAGSFVASLGYDLDTVALEHPSALVTRFFADRRRASGIGLHETGESALRLVDAVRLGRIVALLVDRAFSGRGFETRFLGRRATLPDGHVVIAARAGADLLPCRCRYLPDGSIELFIGDPIEYAGVKRETAERCIEEMERFVREDPAQWFAFDHVWLEEE